MTNVITLPTAYSFDSNQIRVNLIDGEPWFVAADICRAIGIGNPSKALMALDVDEKQTVSASDAHKGQRGGARFHALINESGMYTLVLRCRDAVKPGTNPHRFRKWVTSEVLPSIRRTGAYAVDITPEVPLLINHRQQVELERAVHDLALHAGSQGRNYRSVCLATWRDLRKQFDLKEYCQLPAQRFQEAIDFVLDKRAEWEVDCDARGYTLEHLEALLHSMCLDNRKPERVEVEHARSLVMRTREGIREARMHLGSLAISDPVARTSVRNAKQMLSSKSMAAPIDPWCRSLRRVA